MMASDFLLEILDDVQSEKKSSTNAMNPQYFDTEDEFAPGKVTEEHEGDVLFGGGGIKMESDEESTY
jgi:hypothetical protein